VFYFVDSFFLEHEQFAAFVFYSRRHATTSFAIYLKQDNEQLIRRKTRKKCVQLGSKSLVVSSLYLPLSRCLSIPLSRCLSLPSSAALMLAKGCSYNRCNNHSSGINDNKGDNQYTWRESSYKCLIGQTWVLIQIEWNKLVYTGKMLLLSEPWLKTTHTYDRKSRISTFLIVACSLCSLITILIVKKASAHATLWFFYWEKCR